MSIIAMKQDNQISYVAAIRQPHSDGLFVEASCCLGNDDDGYDNKEPIEKFARYKLKSIENVSVLCALWVHHTKRCLSLTRLFHRVHTPSFY